MGFKSAVFRIVATVLGAGLLLPSGAQAQTGPDYRLACITLDQLSPSIAPPQLARSVRDCIDNDRFEDAIRLFLAYSVYGRYDRLRVRDQVYNKALTDLNNWMFGNYPPIVIFSLRDIAVQLKDRESRFLLLACDAIAAAGAPDYEPYFMIGRGIASELENIDWRVDNFDAAAAWRKSMVEINGCPPA